ncbi:hypothetical protein ACSBR1_042732 [Camellia fascicularis]
MLAHFLLALSYGGTSIRLIEVAQCLKEGKSCIDLMLAETLMGLDTFHRRETTRFAGSLLLLQVLFLTLFDICLIHHSALMLYFLSKPFLNFSLNIYLSIL